MKKIFIFIFIFLFNFNSVNANEKIEVSLSKCVDGDTAYFILNNEEIKTRFLAIDTPESTNKIEIYGKEASNFTCNLLKSSEKIYIEYDSNSDKKDKYNRHLVWVFVDGYLLQNEIIKEGLAEVAYLYDDYKYTDILKESEKIAKEQKLNIWSDKSLSTINDNVKDYSNSDYLFIIVIGIIFILVFIFNKKERVKMTNKIKKNLKKQLKKEIEKQFN